MSPVAANSKETAEKDASNPSTLPSTQPQNSTPSGSPIPILPSQLLLNKILRMFHLEEQSAQQIRAHFWDRGIAFEQFFIEGVVDANTPRSKREKEAQEDIVERMQLFTFTPSENKKGATEKRVESSCADNEFSSEEHGLANATTPAPPTPRSHSEKIAALEERMQLFTFISSERKKGRSEKQIERSCADNGFSGVQQGFVGVLLEFVEHVDLNFEVCTR